MSPQEASVTEVVQRTERDAPRIRFPFENSYTQLPERFYARLHPTGVASPLLIQLNEELARELRLDPQALASDEGVAVLAGNVVPQGAEPAAMAYAGHQFGYFVPQLGDGRAILLGEVVALDGKRYDIQLKGPGRTPFSRGGDGRAALGPVLREYLLSEAMTAMGVPSTRALAAVLTGEQVMRETVLPGAVLTRVAASHLRVGSFQFFAARGDAEGVRALADYAIARHYPEAGEGPQPYRAFLEGVVRRQARLVAQWMLLGFVHGVLNTDNTSISGETIDYGPCAFLEAYDPNAVFSSIDRQGRYAYSNQPHAMLWNLTRLAEALLPVLEGEQGGREAAVSVAKEVLEGFAPQFEAARTAGFQKKLGFFEEREEDSALRDDLLKLMAENGADFTLTFRRLCEAAATPREDGSVAALFADSGAYRAWAVRWRARLAKEPWPDEERSRAMRRINPAFIPRNHLVEAAIVAAVSRDDFGPFRELLGVVVCPYEDRVGMEHLAAAARPEELVTQTFCGT